MYDVIQGIWLPFLVLGIFLVLAVSSEMGYWLGVFVARFYSKLNSRKVVEVLDSNASTIIMSSLGLLALFLGFTFSSAMTHYEQNRQAVITEATAVRSAFRYAQLQPFPFAEKICLQIRNYADSRVSLAKASPNAKGIRETQAKSTQILQQIWASVGALNISNPENRLTQNLVAAIDKMSIAETTRSELLITGVPIGFFVPVSIFLIFNAVLLGIALGEGARRHQLLACGLYFLVALVVGIIIDLDRPLAGLINVDQQSMEIMRDSL